MIAKIAAGIIAVVLAAGLMLAATIALVHFTIAAVSLERWTLRVPALAADVVFGASLLIGCIYLTTHLAVRIVGVGKAEFPALPDTTWSENPAPEDSAKK